jgi:peptidoglycan-associated lipoprotein
MTKVATRISAAESGFPSERATKRNDNASLRGRRNENRSVIRDARLAVVLIAALAMSACANNKPAIDQTLGLSGAAAPGSQQDFVVNVGDRVFFETDSTELTPQARSTLDKQAQWLQTYNRYAFLIEGHADERGTREYNIALGAKRAQTVREYLSSRGIEPSRMRTISYGKERPVAVCDDISCWSQNRRAVTVLSANS